MYDENIIRSSIGLKKSSVSFYDENKLDWYTLQIQILIVRDQEFKFLPLLLSLSIYLLLLLMLICLSMGRSGAT